MPKPQELLSNPTQNGNREDCVSGAGNHRRGTEAGLPAPGASAQLARMAEGLGFDSVVFADTQNLTPEVWGQLMLAARDTERIELGTGVTNPGTRDVAVTASAALALPVESHGRAAGGIGRGDSSLAKARANVAKAGFDGQIELRCADLNNAGQDIDSTPLTGAQFNCGALARGALGPLGLVGGFPALNTISIAENFVDEVASFTLECE